MEYGQTFLALVELFKKFPGIGQRQALRFAHFIIHSDQRYARQLTDTITAAYQASKQCPQCFIRHESDSDICTICLQNGVDTLTIVEKDMDVHVLLASADGNLHTHYFVFGGLIPIANDTSDHVRIQQLMETIKTKKPKEIIIAFSVHPDADHTIRHLADQIRSTFSDITVSALGRGLSSGSEIEYADPETITNALKKRENVL